MSNNITLEDVLKLAVETGKLYMGSEVFSHFSEFVTNGCSSVDITGLQIIRSEYLKPNAISAYELGGSYEK